MSEISAPAGFDALPIPEHLLRRLTDLDYTIPTPIQAQSITPAIKGRDLVGIAQTGTGKTLAFGIPLAVRLSRGRSSLVLAPTRELAEQIQETLYKLGLSTALLIGGKPYHSQFKMLLRRPQVIIATPGRLRDLMGKGEVNLDNVDIVVLDEADRMLDMGFADAISKIFDLLPDDRQVMLYSATMPEDIAKLADKYLKLPARVEVAPAGTAAETVAQELVVCTFEERPGILREILDETDGTVLVFARTRHGARRLAETIRGWEMEAAEIHADLSMFQRKEAMEGFKNGVYKILVATDIAARGIDVKRIELVINYDLPDNPSDYIHRIGRTGRAGEVGKAITFALPEQRHEVRSVEFLLKKELPRSEKSTREIRPAGPVSVTGGGFVGRKPRPGAHKRPRANWKVKG